VITPIAVNDVSNQLDLAEQGIFQAALINYIVLNASKVSYVFAAINLVPPGTNSWLTPVRSAYAYANRSGGLGVLAILSVTTDRPIDNLEPIVDPTLLSLEYDSAVGISAKLFMEYVLLPSMPSVFAHEASAGDFGLDGSAIVNTATLAIDGIKQGAITYYPQIDKLRIETNGSGLFSQYTGYCDLKAGLSMKYQIHTDNAVYFNPLTKGIGFQPDPKPRNSYDVHIPWYWWFLGLIVRGIMEIIVIAISDGIASKLTRNAGEKISLAKNPPSSIQWTETSALNVENASINMNFYMQGSLNQK
jgi:hypothetical protein